MTQIDDDNAISFQHILIFWFQTKCCNGFYNEFRQDFAKETFPYDEHLKSYNIQY